MPVCNFNAFLFLDYYNSLGSSHYSPILSLLPIYFYIVHFNFLRIYAGNTTRMLCVTTKCMLCRQKKTRSLRNTMRSQAFLVFHCFLRYSRCLHLFPPGKQRTFAPFCRFSLRKPLDFHPIYRFYQEKQMVF